MQISAATFTRELHASHISVVSEQVLSPVGDSPGFHITEDASVGAGGSLLEVGESRRHGSRKILEAKGRNGSQASLGAEMAAGRGQPATAFLPGL